MTAGDMHKDRTWTLNEALYFCQAFSKHMGDLGYGVALTGSVLTQSRSLNDLDLVVFPLSTVKHDLAVLHEGLKQFGLDLLVSVEHVHAEWRKVGSADEKHVEKWRFGRKRIDLFFLK